MLPLGNSNVFTAPSPTSFVGSKRVATLGSLASRVPMPGTPSNAPVETRSRWTLVKAECHIRVGVVKINQESAGLEFQVPFGGAKESSSGSREQGEAAKEFFTQWKTVYMDQLTSA